MRKQASTDTDEDILSELLNLQEPRLTHEMMGYLRGPGVMKVFVGFISRYSAPSSTVPASETGGRDWENEEAMRKSYNAMNLLVPKMSDTMNPPQFEALCQRLLPELGMWCPAYAHTCLLKLVLSCCGRFTLMSTFSTCLPSGNTLEHL